MSSRPKAKHGNAGKGEDDENKKKGRKRGDNIKEEERSQHGPIISPVPSNTHNHAAVAASFSSSWQHQKEPYHQQQNQTPPVYVQIRSVCPHCRSEYRQRSPAGTEVICESCGSHAQVPFSPEALASSAAFQDLQLANKMLYNRYMTAESRVTLFREQAEYYQRINFSMSGHGQLERDATSTAAALKKLQASVDMLSQAKQAAEEKQTGTKANLHAILKSEQEKNAMLNHDLAKHKAVLQKLRSELDGAANRTVLEIERLKKELVQLKKQTDQQLTMVQTQHAEELAKKDKETKTRIHTIKSDCEKALHKALAQQKTSLEEATSAKLALDKVKRQEIQAKASIVTKENVRLKLLIQKKAQAHKATVHALQRDLEKEKAGTKSLIDQIKKAKHEKMKSSEAHQSLLEQFEKVKADFLKQKKARSKLDEQVIALSNELREHRDESLLQQEQAKNKLQCLKTRLQEAGLSTEDEALTPRSAASSPSPANGQPRESNSRRRRDRRRRRQNKKSKGATGAKDTTTVSGSEVDVVNQVEFPAATSLIVENLTLLSALRKVAEYIGIEGLETSGKGFKLKVENKGEEKEETATRLSVDELVDKIYDRIKSLRVSVEIVSVFICRLAAQLSPKEQLTVQIRLVDPKDMLADLKTMISSLREYEFEHTLQQAILHQTTFVYRQEALDVLGDVLFSALQKTREFLQTVTGIYRKRVKEKTEMYKMTQSVSIVTFKEMWGESGGSNFVSKTELMPLLFFDTRFREVAKAWNMSTASVASMHFTRDHLQTLLIRANGQLNHVLEFLFLGCDRQIKVGLMSLFNIMCCRVAVGDSRLHEKMVEAIDLVQAASEAAEKQGITSRLNKIVALLNRKVETEEDAEDVDEEDETSEENTASLDGMTTKKVKQRLETGIGDFDSESIFECILFHGRVASDALRQRFMADTQEGEKDERGEPGKSVPSAPKTDADGYIRCKINFSINTADDVIGQIKAQLIEHGFIEPYISNLTPRAVSIIAQNMEGVTQPKIISFCLCCRIKNAEGLHIKKCGTVQTNHDILDAMQIEDLCVVYHASEQVGTLEQLGTPIIDETNKRFDVQTDHSCMPLVYALHRSATKLSRPSSIREAVDQRNNTHSLVDKAAVRTATMMDKKKQEIDMEAQKRFTELSKSMTRTVLKAAGGKERKERKDPMDMLKRFSNQIGRALVSIRTQGKDAL